MSMAVVLGSMNFDIVATADRLPTTGETVNGSSVNMFVGGKGANQAVQLASLGLKTIFIGQVGQDEMGDTVQKSLASKGIERDYLLVSDEYSTGCASIFIDSSGDNMLVHFPGANKHIPLTLIDNAAPLIQRANVFVTQNEINVDAIIHGLSIAHNAGVPTIFNPAPAIKLDDIIFSYVDYITPNEKECESYTGIKLESLPFEQWKKESAKWFMNRGVKNVCITLGNKGAYFYDGKTEYDIPAFQVNAVDATAAGDAFNGGFAYGIAKRLPVSKCLQIGSACGALATTILGAQNSIHPFEKVFAFLEEKDIHI